LQFSGTDKPLVVDIISWLIYNWTSIRAAGDITPLLLKTRLW